MKKFFKIGLIGALSICLFVITYIAVLFISSPISFDKTKITNSNLIINIYDSEKRPLKHTYLNGDYVKLNQIPLYTKQCFISIEDKGFYSHPGINLKRIVGATIKNIASFSFKEGASTISQQLIKNTHLTNEKSIKRKLNEIKLTMQLEKAFTKDEILEYYLNIIYFGDNCYGIQNASEHYFSKPVSKLSLDESAVLAGIIKSPNKYHPIKQYKNCINRRNLVLKEMKKDGNISDAEYNVAITNQTEIKLKEDYGVKSAYANATIKEAEKILKMPEKLIAVGGYKIYTYMNLEKQTAIEDTIENSLVEDCSMISISSKTGHIEAYGEKSSMSLVNVKRQPASAIKPLLVYAPAINENIISPSTVILDEKISINGYEPKNIGNKEHGYVNAKTALSDSLNIPAVKILSYVGIDKAKQYMQRQNIEFNKEDNNLALALGGMTYGLTLRELTNCYQTLANDGNYINAKFIDYIFDNNGNMIYKNNDIANTIFRNDTTYLITDMLRQGAKTGTAKRLSDLPFYVASKTGTSSISNQNLDAYNVSYTTEDVVGCWIGNINNEPIKIVGGGKPTAYVKNYLTKIYSTHKPSPFVKPSSVVEIEIDEIALQNEHVLYKANPFLPERYRSKAFFSRFNQPKVNYDDSLVINPPKISGKVVNGVANISFNADMYYEYELYTIKNGDEILLDTLKHKNGICSFNIAQESSTINRYYIKVKAKNYTTEETIESDASNIVELYYQ